MKKKLIVLFFIFISGVAIGAEVYKWTDTNGVVHYSDAPDNHSAQIVELPSLAPVTSNITPPSATIETSAPATSLNTTSTQQEQQQAIAQQKQNEAYCTQAKANLSLLQETGRRVYTVTPKGEYIYFNDAQRQQEIKKTQEQINIFCEQTK